MEVEGQDSPQDGILAMDAEERRVLGVLIEKGLTTPQAYPLSLNAVVAGCNQQSNRDPVTHFSEDQVVHILQRLQIRGFVSEVFPSSGRVSRFRQELGAKYELRGAELGIVGELLLRGAQSEGELRQRASRMRNIANLAELHEILARLAAHEPPFVVRLTPEGVSRGVRYTHCCCPRDELAQQIQADRSGAASAPRAAPVTAALEQRIAALEERVAALEQATQQAN